MARNSGGGNFFNRPLNQNYSEDCDMLFFCEKNAQTYRLCYSGSPLTSKRCTPAEKNQMLMFSQVVHRVQLIDETIKQLDSDLSKLLKRTETSNSPKAESAPRIDQSQAASLVAPAAPTTEPSFDRNAFSTGIPNISFSSSEQERIVRRSEIDKPKK